MPKPERQQNVLDLLKGLRGIEPLKQLFWSELNYQRVNEPLSRRGWTDSASKALADDPVFFAGGGENNDFHVIYGRLASDRLLLGNERPVVSRLVKEHPYALFVFSNKTQDRWHFLNVKYDDTAEKRRLFRRITVGPEERLRTASERLSLLSLDAISPELFGIAPLTIQQHHDQAFDVEAVTDEFFREYRVLFEDTERQIEGFRDHETKRLFTQRLFNRLMFIGFIQKKGWLKFDDNTDYLHALWTGYQRTKDDNANFYRDRVKRLFFHGLNTSNEVNQIGINRGGLLGKLIGEVPYLNGGLFEEDEDDKNPKIVVPDECLRRVLRELFERFNFTVTESTPLDVEVAVDPEMLGRVFEELVTGRHETGSYYTPKPVVSFMCRESLKSWLAAALPGEKTTSLVKFVDQHDGTGIRNPATVLQTLRNIKVCDPACGSGAYLLGMLHELIDLRTCLVASHSLDHVSLYEHKLEIIQSNLYGVDLDPFAVNIARLRLWLSLAVEFEGEVPQPLPNLDFKIEIGDSLTAPNPETIGQQAFRDKLVRQYRDSKGHFMTSHGAKKTGLRGEVAALRRDIAQWTHQGQHVAGFDWAVEFAEVFADGGFSIVVANPPYLSTKHGFGKTNPLELRRLYRTAKGQFDAYGLFVERGISLLLNGGCYSYIIPKPVLTNSNMLPVRETMQSNRLLAVADPGQVFKASVEPIVIVGQKCKPDGKSVRLYDERIFKGEDCPICERTISELVTPAGTWNAIVGSQGAGHAKMYRSLPTFGQFFAITRGVECGKRDSSIHQQQVKGAYPLLRGEDVDRFKVVHSGYYIRRDDDDKKFKPMHLYNPPSLLIRRVTNDLMAAIDYKGFHVLNTIYVAHPRPGCPISLEYACALLNSELVNDYFHQVYLNDDKLFPYVRKEQIEQLPIALPAQKDEAEITRLVRELSKSTGVERRASLEKEIQELVAAIYGSAERKTPDATKKHKV